MFVEVWSYAEARDGCSAVGRRELAHNVVAEAITDVRQVRVNLLVQFARLAGDDQASAGPEFLVGVEFMEALVDVDAEGECLVGE